MPTRPRPRLPAALALALIAAPAVAQTTPPPLTPEQNASLMQALRLWSPGTVTGDYTVMPEGDHYRLTRAIPQPMGPNGAKIEGGALTASVRPLDQGRWQFDGISYALPLTITAPQKNDQVLKVVLNGHGQTGHGVIDPSLATGSKLELTLGGMEGTIEAPPDETGTFSTGAISDTLTWTPADPGATDHTIQGSVATLSLGFIGKKAVQISAGGMHGEIIAKGERPERVNAFVAAARNAPKPAAPPAAAAPLAPGSAAPFAAQTSPEQKAWLRKLLAASRGMADSLAVDGTLNDLAVVSGASTLRLHRVAIAESLGAPQGKADISMRLSVDGPSSTAIPAAVAALVPHRIAFAPHVSGIPADDLYAWLDSLLSQPGTPDQADMQARFAALVAKGPVTLGIDELAFDVGPALFSAVGSLRVAAAGPGGVTGQASVEAKGLNALIQRASTDPLLHQAQPVLIFLKGIGDEDDHGNVTWKVLYSGGKVTVNGTDLSQLIPHK